LLTDYKFGIRLTSSGGSAPPSTGGESGGGGGKVLLMLNARNDQDRQKFVDDLREAILEVGEKGGARRVLEGGGRRGGSRFILKPNRERASPSPRLKVGKRLKLYRVKLTCFPCIFLRG